jgi:catechol 2,3-dioxygenase-like lactoylglutathione lyase family enzyme
MVKTHGLTHIALAVRSAERSLQFYHDVFGAEAYHREPGRIHVKTPGCHDVVTLDEHAPNPGTSGGIIHFGFRLQSPADIDTAVNDVQKAGGKLLSRGEFAPGYPYAYVTDPDGYELEIWFE